MDKSPEQTIVDFLKSVESLKSTIRHNWTKSGRRESAAEHSWRMAVFFIIAQDLLNFEVDFTKTIKMLLIHDIPELVAGDIPGFIKEKNRQQYLNQEIHNSQQIFDILPDPLNQKYLDLYQEFEAGETPEAKLARAVPIVEAMVALTLIDHYLRHKAQNG